MCMYMYTIHYVCSSIFSTERPINTYMYLFFITFIVVYVYILILLHILIYISYLPIYMLYTARHVRSRDDATLSHLATR